MERNIQRYGLVNLLVLLAASAVGFAVARYANSLTGQVASGFIGLGVLVAFVSWFQMRLEAGERNERLELEELARAKGSATLFEAKAAEVFPAQRAREQFERFFVPGFTIVLLLLQAAGAFFAWRWLTKLPAVPPLKQDLVAMSLFGLLALALFLIGRFSATIARLENHRLLRPSASFLLLGAYLCFFAALAIAAVKGEFPNTDFHVARVLSLLLGLVAVETLLTLVLEIYRPRVKGKIVRPLYESRLVGLLAQPEGLVTTAAQALDYQFGFKVSETWVYRFFEKALAWLVLLQLGVLLLSTSVVFIEAGEQALLERFGRPVAGRTVLGPGAHFKWPWPVDQVYRYRTEEIQTLNVGFEPEEDHAGKVVLWTLAHTKEENFLVANREQALAENSAPQAARKAPPVSLITVSIPIQYHVTNLFDWAYNHEDSSNLLQQVATREVVRYLVSVDLNEIMSKHRLESAEKLRDRVQAGADAHHLGARILSVSLADIHPPVKVAPDYEKVVGAIHQKQAKILEAEAEAIRTNALAGANAFAITNTAEAARLRSEQTALARAAAFTNQLPAFNAAPSVYKQRALLRTFPHAVARARKYVLLATNTQVVITFDLQQRIEDEYFQKVSGAVPEAKK